MTTLALVCLIVSIVLFVSYISYIYIKYRPDCISRSYYLLRNGNIFTIWILCVSFLIFPAWVEVSPINYQFLPFLSVVSLSTVGIFPRYLDSDRQLHLTAAAISGIISLIWNILIGTYLFPTIFLVILIILYSNNVANKFFWTECSSFLNIYLSILI